MGNRIKLFVVSVMGGIFFCNGFAAPIGLGGTRYSQDFNSIATGLPPGWSVREDATPTSLGTIVALETNATTWASSTGEFRNCASITNNSGMLLTNAAPITQHAFTNRVLAVRQGSSFGDPGAAYVFQASDTLGLSNLTFGVDFFMLDVEDRETVWTIDYGVGATPASFTPVGIHTNTGPQGSTVRKTFALGSDANDQAELLSIRVVALAGATGSGSRDTFAIDNVVVSFNGESVEEAVLLQERQGEQWVLSWDDPSFALQSAPFMGGVFTNVPGATSPHTPSMSADAGYFRLAK